MPSYRFVDITFPDGRKMHIIAEDKEVNVDLVSLQRNYGAKVKIGRLLGKDEAAHLLRVQSQRRARRRGAEPARPLSPDMGRGSGGPI